MQHVSKRALLTRGLGLEVRSVRGEVSCEEDLSILGRCSIKGSIMVWQILDFLIFLQAAIEMFI